MWAPPPTAAAESWRPEKAVFAKLHGTGRTLLEHTDELCCPTRNIKPSEGTGGHTRVGRSRNEKGYGAQGGRGAHQGRDEGGSRQRTVAATRRAARWPTPKTKDSPAATRSSWGPFPSAFLTSRNRFLFSKVHHRAAKRVGISGSTNAQG